MHFALKLTLFVITSEWALKNKKLRAKWFHPILQNSAFYYFSLAIALTISDDTHHCIYMPASMQSFCCTHRSTPKLLYDLCNHVDASQSVHHLSMSFPYFVGCVCNTCIKRNALQCPKYANRVGTYKSRVLAPRQGVTALHFVVDSATFCSICNLTVYQV